MFHRSRITSWTCFLFGLACLATHARAEQVCHTVAVPTTATNFDVGIAIPRFDTLLGTLTSVSVSFQVLASGSSQVESLETSAWSGSAVPGVLVRVLDANDGILGEASTDAETPLELAAYDGVSDYAGLSGQTVPSAALPIVVGSGSSSDSGTLGLYAGPAGNPGPSGTRVVAVGISVVTGAGELLSTFSTQASVSVTVCYTYAPRITSLCFGDGSGAACPCDNESTAPTGCLNSFGFGSLLSATGGAFVGSDTLQLSATVPGSNTTLFFQGTAAVGGGSGELFGDGLHCAGGTTIELISLSAISGVAEFPRTGDPLVSEAGSVSAGVTRYYQAWYRNSASFCTESTWNLSNALQVVWGA